MTRCLIALTFLALLASASEAALLEYTAAHADVRPVYDGQELSLRYRFDTNAVLDGTPLPSPTLVEPSEAYVRVADTTVVDPADQSLFFSFFPEMFVSLGEPTTPYWVLPQGNVVGQPFFGFSTEELVSAEWSGSFDIALTDFSGPGDFTLYKDGFPPTVQHSTADGAGSFVFPQGHDHFNWAFTQPGVYALELTISGTHHTDGLKSASDTFYFAVGDSTRIPEPGTLLLAGASVLGLFSATRRRG